MDQVTELFGQNVFDEETMRERLPKDTFRELQKTTQEGKPLNIKMVRFDKDLKVTIQDLGWRHDGRYNNQKSDISSTTFWYQAEPHAKFPALPSKDDLEIPRW